MQIKNSTSPGIQISWQILKLVSPDSVPDALQTVLLEAEKLKTTFPRLLTAPYDTTHDLVFLKQVHPRHKICEVKLQ